MSLFYKIIMNDHPSFCVFDYNERIFDFFETVQKMRDSRAPSQSAEPMLAKADIIMSLDISWKKLERSKLKK